jgi:hypothetical protein
MPLPLRSNGNVNGYDRRFIGIFMSELERWNSPRFAESGWFTALRRADYEFRYLPPLQSLPTGHGTGHNTLPPEVSGVRESPKQLYAGFGAYSPEGVLRSVDEACSKWLHQHGLHQSRKGML